MRLFIFIAMNTFNEFIFVTHFYEIIRNLNKKKFNATSCILNHNLHIYNLYTGFFLQNNAEI